MKKIKKFVFSSHIVKFGNDRKAIVIPTKYLDKIKDYSGIDLIVTIQSIDSIEAAKD